MIIKNTQQTIIIDLNFDIKRVGIKMSGGADSAVICYILSLYAATERPDIRLVPITVAQHGKAYQVIHAAKVIEFCRERFGDIFSVHHTDYSIDPDTDYFEKQTALLNRLYENKQIDCHFSGITLNPPDDAIPKTVYDSGFKLPRPETGIIDRTRTDHFKPVRNGRANYPLINIDKRGVAELYQTLEVTDTLFPLTRSCEQYTDDFTRHCGVCWFCNERFWGFGRYE